jgi:hypothetical protein
MYAGAKAADADAKGSIYAGTIVGVAAEAPVSI